MRIAPTSCAQQWSASYGIARQKNAAANFRRRAPKLPPTYSRGGSKDRRLGRPVSGGIVRVAPTTLTIRPSTIAQHLSGLAQRFRVRSFSDFFRKKIMLCDNWNCLIQRADCFALTHSGAGLLAH
jgi:hypothetical protein